MSAVSSVNLLSVTIAILPNEAAITRIVGALLMEQSDEWAVQRARYMTLETMAPLSDNPIVMLSAVPAHDRLKLTPKNAGNDPSYTISRDTTEKWDHPSLGASRHSAFGAKGPAHGISLYLWGDLPR
ncbi:MAG: family transposase [Bradyrhizobium sp.]|nr:family transposase [Bradyrhizobium sp.]